ncbi:MAG: hypothetical protein A2219_07635 [Elusimicrobia bacterium RIFOXYA2_FULL_50_26]|nr:MAG: hypothetical protein A2219_07635 [Elusimicrobia bacterium RIFOXYA2_FULL_50_26]OGS24652.1 MAG: hypothetical protein A2314_05530 [Elusimicrobia bacterium RIFOXYB2_FULL_50_12]
MSYSVIFITASNAAEAGNIASSLVKEKLAACANVAGGVSSTYWWKGNIETADEVLVIAKSKTALVEKIIERVRQLHSYEVPEIIALPIESGNKAYLQWIEESVL